MAAVAGIEEMGKAIMLASNNAPIDMFIKLWKFIQRQARVHDSELIAALKKENLKEDKLEKDIERTEEELRSADAQVRNGLEKNDYDLDGVDEDINGTSNDWIEAGRKLKEMVDQRRAQLLEGQKQMQGKFDDINRRMAALGMRVERAVPASAVLN